ncbi:hypothetical protein [Streptomyces sp. NBC_00083]|uniref:hypothetical protein n=1 Tax=Streptomyces sp. NBC_00083 TaxID=2975647 RepID=UPI0022522E6F|nr:hypothetical protein [Streptomyces sp. NBC_00083]MCX5387564.1 hypothetical protein [Streptomyces sp. NBC_00083]
MTSTTGTTEHPDVSEISELTEGLLPPARTADVRRHLQGCALCADVRDSLEEIRDLLGTLPGPPRMPADVVGRIDAALAAEALLNATAPGGGPRETAGVSRETPETPTTPASAAPSTPSGTPPHDRPAGHARAAAGPGPGRGRKNRRRAAVLTAVLGAAAVGAGIFFVQSLQSPTTAPRAEHAESQAAPSDGTSFSAGSLEGHVQSLLASQGAQSTQKAPSAQIAPSTKNAPNSEKSSDTVRSAAAVPPCVQAGTGRPSETPLATEQGTYEGTRVYLVVLPDQGDPSAVEAYVVDAACENAGPSAHGKVLLARSYPRH